MWLHVLSAVFQCPLPLQHVSMCTMRTKVHGWLGCRGFLSVSKIGLEKAVDSIFSDQGMVGLAKQLFCQSEWKSGVATQSYLLTLDDYLGDLNEWLDPPFFKRALEVFLPP